MAARLPSLPKLLQNKIYKTGQTRGADDDEIFQNRVSRSGTVLIPLRVWQTVPSVRQEVYENGFIVLVPPDEYFATQAPDVFLSTLGLQIGVNALLFYDRRSQWVQFDPTAMGLQVAVSRTAPLGGQYVARVAGTTAREQGERIARGFTGETGKGAGIRLYEYANSEVINLARLQLEALFWHCYDAVEAASSFEMYEEDALIRKEAILQDASQTGLLDYGRLQRARVLNSDGMTVCPLCLLPLGARGFFSRLAQAEGREVHDLTVTEVNLFHIAELRYGSLNHRPYNLGWGHHHCNVVVKDSGIDATLAWMSEVLSRNAEEPA